MMTELAKGVYWVGVVDWGIRHFHGHELSTHRGSSYNSYLIKGDKTVLVDTVWDPFQDEWIENLRQIVDPATIDIIVANHSEPDHSGCLPALLKLCPKAQVVVSKRGAESIPGHYHQAWNFKAVATGDRIAIGQGMDMVFIEAPMLHWPDSMFTYVAGPNILMSNDAFGQHYAADSRFNDHVDQGELFEEALKYYVNILTPFSAQVTKKIEEIVAMNVPVSMIAPSHGILWRTDPMQIVGKYQQWAAQKPEKRAVILYDSMWQATRKMAEAIGEGLAADGVPFRILQMAVTDRNDALVEVFRSRAVLVGSPTLNMGLLPSIMPILEDLRGLKFKNKVGASFGSYGWSGEGVRLIDEHFEKCRIPLAAPHVLAKWQPTAEDLDRCRAMGRTVAKAVQADV
jgi:anaerobic nitric oxide reductase flavorubredoxin